MAIKFPLKMKNNVEVRDLRSLQENFDQEKAVSYFLDGKLQRWLETRYYDEQLELVNQLEKEDAELAKKLCSIFGVKFVKSEIDTESVELKNQRLRMVKQITDDEEVLENIDCVAFNQEELSELYDKNTQIIYLLKGEFNIPKSKIDVNYKEYGNPTIHWPKKIEESIKENPKNLNVNTNKSYIMPRTVADKIKLNSYAVTQDYVVYSESKFMEYKMIVIRKNGEFVKEIKSTFDIKFYHKPKLCFMNKNKVLINIMEQSLIIYDIDSDEQELIAVGDTYNLQVSGNNLIYYENKPSTYTETNLILYDCERKLKKNITTKIKGESNYCVSCGKIYYYKDSKIHCYSILENKSNVLYNDVNLAVDIEMTIQNNHLYIFSRNYNSENRLIRLNINDLTEMHSEIFRFKAHLSKIKMYPDYIIYNDTQSSYPLYLFDIKQNSLKHMASGCGYYTTIDYWIKSSDYVDHLNDFNLVGDYIFYEKGKEQDIYRIDIRTREEIKMR